MIKFKYCTDCVYLNKHYRKAHCTRNAVINPQTNEYSDFSIRVRRRINSAEITPYMLIQCEDKRARVVMK